MPTLIYGLIGHPVKHSLSPAMQNAAFKELGIDARYELFDVEPDRLDDFLSKLAAAHIAGVNVTIPHKVRALAYIEKNGILDEHARRLGAINTIQVTGASLKGHNTDGPGFYRSLVEDLGFTPEGKTITVLGAGGGAHGVIMYLGNGPAKIYVTDIDRGKLDELARHYAAQYDAKRLVTVAPTELAHAVAASELLINTTPVGMKEDDPVPLDVALLHPGLYVYDLIYNRPRTRLVKAAAEKKLHAVTGIGMLLYQGAIAFEIWTGKPAPIAVMRRALTQALAKE